MNTNTRLPGMTPEIEAELARIEKEYPTEEDMKREAEINAILQAGAREHARVLAWSKVYGANKVYK